MKKIEIKTLFTNLDEQLRRYFNDIRRIPVMTEEEEKELVAHLDEQACRDRLISANLRFVVSVAKQYQGNGLPLNDLISLGNLGLCKSVEYYNPEFGVKFLSYAGWWIRQSIILGLNEDVKAVSTPNVARHNFNKIKRCVNRYFVEHGIEPPESYIMDKLHLTESEYSRAMKCCTTYSSTNETVPDCDKPVEMQDMMQSDEKTYDDIIEADGNSVVLRNAIAKLEWPERFVITRIFGIDCKPIPIREISAELNLSPERVRQLRSKAFESIKEQLKKAAME